MSPLITFVDVSYSGSMAFAACVTIDSWKNTARRKVYLTGPIPVTEPYRPGQFYRRELPCILRALEALPCEPNTVVVDGYVWTAAGKPGLGAELHDALGDSTAVIGVAKNPFRGAEDVSIEVRRGSSSRPLYVTAIGLPLATAAQRIHEMSGAHRIPELVRLADAEAKAALRIHLQPEVKESCRSTMSKS